MLNLSEIRPQLSIIHEAVFTRPKFFKYFTELNFIKIKLKPKCNKKNPYVLFYR